MRTIENDATLSPGGGQYNLKGYLLYAVNGAIVEKAFKYSIEAHRTYSVEESVMAKINIIPSETILIQDITLPIARGHKIKIYEGGAEKIMQVESAEYVTDNKKAFMTGDPRVAWRVFLKGG